MGTGNGFDPSLLPESPWAFFQLGEGSGEKDLRRSYFAAISGFRPETHPEEFQRIREAYELLLAWFRAGNMARPSTLEAEPVPRDYLGTPGARRAVARDLDASASTPRDHLVLALLADLGEAPGGTFGSRLLHGLSLHPGDPGLAAVFREFLASSVPLERIPSILESASEKVPGSSFWSATDAAWEIAAIGLPFDEFHRLWKRIEPREDGLDEGPRVRMMCRVLPHLAAVAPRSFLDAWEEWIHERLAFTRGAEEVLDVLESSRALQAIREREVRATPAGRGQAPVPRRLREPGPAEAAFPAGPVGKVVHELVRAVYSARGPGGEARLRKAARTVLAMRASVLREFAPPDRALAAALATLPRVSFLMARHLLPATSELTRFEEAKLVRTVHGNAELAISRFEVGFREWVRTALRVLPAPANLLRGLVAFLLVSMAVVGFTVFMMHFRNMGRDFGWLIGLALMAGTVAGSVWGYPRLPKGPDNSPAAVRRRQILRLYATVVRDRAVYAVMDMGIVPSALVDGNCVDAAGRNPVLFEGAAEDPALPILWTAHRFAR